jgi:hypothetical protein
MGVFAIRCIYSDYENLSDYSLPTKSETASAGGGSRQFPHEGQVPTRRGQMQFDLGRWYQTAFDDKAEVEDFEPTALKRALSVVLRTWQWQAEMRRYPTVKIGCIWESSLRLQLQAIWAHRPAVCVGRDYCAGVRE